MNLTDLAVEKYQTITNKSIPKGKEDSVRKHISVVISVIEDILQEHQQRIAELEKQILKS